MNFKKIAACAAAAMTLVCGATAMSASAAAQKKFAYAKGDINGDGAINITDFVMINAHIKGINAIKTVKGRGAADVNFDNKIDITDLQMINAHIKCFKALADGDVDADGKVTSYDLYAVMDHITGEEALTKCQCTWADVNYDKTVDVTDYVMLRNYYNKFAK